MRNDSEELLTQHVSVVCAAGNAALERRSDGTVRKEVDAAPAMFSMGTANTRSAPGLPIIVAGNCDDLRQNCSHVPGRWAMILSETV